MGDCESLPERLVLSPNRFT